MKVRCVESKSPSFTVGKIYEYSKQSLIDDEYINLNPRCELSEWNNFQWDTAYIKLAKFEEVK